MEGIMTESLVIEEPGIGLYNEKSLHSDIKRWYALPGDRLEVRVDGYIVDLVRDELLIEIQTRNFYAIKNKLKKLAKNHKVLLVHPIAAEKLIIYMDEAGEMLLSKKRSPKKGRVTDIFDNLVRTADLINDPNIEIEVILTKEEEIRCDDGKGSWRRKGVSIRDRKLSEVIDIVRFKNAEDFLKLLPEGLEKPFTNASLAKALRITKSKAQKLSYSLKIMGAIEAMGKSGNSILYETVEKASGNFIPI
jgi:hypothetical protein